MSGHFRSPVHFRSSNSPTGQPPHHSTKQAKIITACIFSTFAILILLALCYVRRYWRRRNQQANRVNNAVISTPTTSTPCGPEVLASLPIFVYSVKDEEQKSLLECAVCLGEFKEGEKGRNLPRCGHSFHVECIDMWLDSHVTCPLCRVSVGDPEAASSESLDSVV